ncbi:nickel/cobalt transporter [Marinibaculum pumilum]|uniref:Nickel/cobalt efflux system n=1 Tax=Marinibaculum pumilum TaxID=1766165 RepID=A0ABV7L9C1_9PROT
MTESAGRLLAALLLSLAVLWSGQALAETAAAAIVDPGLWDRTMAWIFAEQRAWHHDLVAQMRGLGSGGSQTTAWALILASFLYGLFHAAGPGHGKVVLASYLLSHRQRVGRGVALAAASAFCQGVVAVILVYGLLYLTDLLPRDTKTAVNWTERGSFVLLGVLGLWLAARALRDGIRVWQPATAGAHGHGHDHGHHHDHHDRHDGQAHGHVHGPGCGHSHGPSADQIESAGSLRGAIAVILSIGLRPCSGAVLVLVLAQAMALPLAGLAAVLAMSCGTALAVAALALVAVHARRWAAALAGGGAGGTGDGGRGLALAGLAVRLAGGLVILALGASLFAASFAPAHPLGM